jgi:hypothetical protein
MATPSTSGTATPKTSGSPPGMGVNTFPFSVEWARTQPRAGVWDQQELAYYDDVIAET